jgi:dTDP-4-dehydrorhamnose reductase
MNRHHAQPAILLTGGSGALGSAIRACISCVAPDSRELDVTKPATCRDAVARYRPDLVIHAAALTDVAACEQDRERCFRVNVLGTQNMVRAAAGTRFVYMSSEYVFDGERGMYTEDDMPDPISFYGLTKLLGEITVDQYPNTLVVRAPFRKDGAWAYPVAPTDQWTSAASVSEVAPLVVAAASSGLTGVIHITAAPRRSIYEIARSMSPSVRPVTRADITARLPRDTSLDASRWGALRKHSRPPL